MLYFSFLRNGKLKVKILIYCTKLTAILKIKSDFLNIKPNIMIIK